MPVNDERHDRLHKRSDAPAPAPKPIDPVIPYWNTVDHVLSGRMFWRDMLKASVSGLVVAVVLGLILLLRP